MDPLGFSLENFDATGKWRTESDGAPIDAIPLAQVEPFLKDLTTRSRSTIGSRLPSFAKAMMRFATSITAGSLSAADITRSR